MVRRSWLAYALISLGTAGIVLLSVWIFSVRWASPRCVWRAPAGQSIRYIHGSGRSGHILVLTEDMQNWRLYDVTSTGSHHEVASGSGSAQSLVALSGVSQRGDRVLIGTKESAQLKGYRLTLCDLSSGTTTQVGDLSSAFSNVLRRPFSPHDQRMLVFGREGKRIGVWVFDPAQKSKEFLLEEQEACDVFWLEKGGICVFERPSGSLYYVRLGEPLVTRKRFAPAMLMSIAPDESRVFAVDGQPRIAVRLTDLSTGKQRITYTGSSWGIPLDADWSTDGQRVAIFVTGPDPTPVVLDRDGRQRVVRGGTRNIKETAGIAFWGPRDLAYVKREVGNRRDCVMSVSVN